MITLDKYGSACRCLLRLRENSGEAPMSDATFIARFTSRYPDWLDRPGTTDIVRMGEIAQQLGLADRIEVYRDYDHILRLHREGCGILICTDRVPEQHEELAVPARYVLLLVAMDETAFTAWSPYPSGNSDILPTAKRVWWDHWQAIGVVLHGRPKNHGDTSSSTSPPVA